MTAHRSRLRRSTARSLTVSLLIGALLIPIQATYTLDTTFNNSGKFTIAFPDSSSNYTSRAFRVFVQPNNRIVVAGSFTNGTPDGQLAGVAFVGITAGGSLDSTFGSTGVAVDWRPDASTNFADALMYPDGTTLRMAQVFRLPVGSSTVRTVRLTPNGSEDSVFASNVSIGPCCLGFFAARPVQIAVRPDGKILALITDQGSYFLYRLNPDGTRDTTFGVNGVLGIGFNKFLPTNFIEMVAMDDGKILLVGQVPPYTTTAGSSEFFLARLTESGNWDKTFGRSGFVRMPFGPGLTCRIHDAVVQPDAKILLTGSAINSDSDVWMMRLRSNGRVDSSLGTAGVVIRDFDPAGTDTATAATLSPDGKIRIAGFFGTPASFLVARFSANGTFEESTGIPFTPGQYALAYDIAFQSDGKLLVVGETKNPSPTTTGSSFAVARLIE